MSLAPLVLQRSVGARAALVTEQQVSGLESSSKSSDKNLVPSREEAGCRKQSKARSQSSTAGLDP